MRRINSLFAGPVLAGILAMMPAAAFANGGGGHGFGGGGGGHSFVGGGHAFGGRSGRGFSSGFRGTRGFATGRFSDRGRFGDRSFRGHDRDSRDRRFRNFDGNSFDFGYSGFGYPDYYQYDYPYYYPYSYYSDDFDQSGDNYGTYRSPGSSVLTTSVQSALENRGYYHGQIDGVIGAGSRSAIRNFQTDQGLPVTGSIDRKLLSALRIG
jgi:putative peptidoglycan binding protein